MERLRYEFVLEAAQPIAHHAESIGNEAILMRRRLRYRGGWAEVPVITGDTMRHGLREAAAYALLDAAGLLDEGAAALSEAALRLLFAGGMVTGSSGGAVKLTEYWQLCDLIPPLALLGGCVSNRVVPGRLVVEDATLVCDEAERYLPPWVVAYAREQLGDLGSGRACVEEVQRTRMDPTLDPGKRRLLAADAAKAVQGRLLASEEAASAENPAAKEEAKSSLMPRRFERVAQGALFSWCVEATIYTELERDTFHVMCAAFLARARVGGKRGTGHGHLRPVTARSVGIRRPAEDLDVLDPGALAPKIGQLFRAHVAERRGALKAALDEVVA